MSTLYLVATPIGNLSDLSPRAREVLSTVDFIAAEDTRVTQKLLNACELPKKPMISYYEHNRRCVERIARFDLFDLQHRLPRRLLQLPYDLLNRINRRRLLRQNEALTTSIRMDDYRIAPAAEGCFDLFFIATK